MSCNSGDYLSADNSSCVSDCGPIGEFLNTAKGKCVADCNAEDNLLTGVDGITCVNECNSDEYLLNKKCTKCSS